MKKFLISILIIFLSITSFAETKTFYIARHGQRGDGKYRVNFKNISDDGLMPKGIEQAKALGKYLESIGFNGTVYVSPYYRTLQTATYALSQMSPKTIILEPRIQEVPGVKDSSGIVRITKKCLTKKEIKKNFPSVKIPKKMKFPWRIENEKQSQTDQRIEEFIEDILQSTDNEILVVGHGGITSAFIRVMNKRGADIKKGTIYNCSLYQFTIDTENGKVISCGEDTQNYMPSDLYTDNLVEYTKEQENK